ncbi:MAG: aminopeptidase [Desulfobacterales bacterium CG23_combo_of_CG06-09_8_20_14_all_51_8]|nr:MAG: aminopeptidase [Desulfobacterales bacterium CG23_combo_of_CG06-09_8_20_14_all_51_8]
MLTATQLDRYADVLLWGLETARRGKIKKNDIMVIRYNLPAIRLVEILYKKLIEMGVHPLHRLMQTPEMEKNFYSLSSKNQLVFIPPGEEELYKNLNGAIAVLAPESLTHLSGVDASKISESLKARKALREILDQREEQGLFSWTLGMYPTPELAVHAAMTEKEYSDEIIRACFLNRVDPVAQWEAVFGRAKTLKKWLNRMEVSTYHIESDHVDLEITPGDKRRWIGISGHNIPSFELFLSPDWRGTRGRYFADQPSYRSGNYVSGIRLEFKKGKVVQAVAEQGGAFLKTQLAMDDGACRLGEFSLTDKTFSKISRFMANTLFDENFGGKFGNCHVALGASYSDTYNGNPSELTRELKKNLGFNDSALHWDIVNTEKKRVTAHLKDGTKAVIYENGCFIN